MNSRSLGLSDSIGDLGTVHLRTQGRAAGQVRLSSYLKWERLGRRGRWHVGRGWRSR